MPWRWDTRTRATVVVVLSFLLFAAGSTLYSNFVASRAEHRANTNSQRLADEAAESDRRWCGMLGSLDRAYKANPPTTSTGQEIAAETARLRTQFGCDGK